MEYTNLAYVAAAILFIIGIKRLSSPKSAQSGNTIASIGYDANDTPADPVVYEKLDFERLSERKDYYKTENGKENAIIMHRIL